MVAGKGVGGRGWGRGDRGGFGDGGLWGGGLLLWGGLAGCFCSPYVSLVPPAEDCEPRNGLSHRLPAFFISTCDVVKGM